MAIGVGLGFATLLVLCGARSTYNYLRHGSRGGIFKVRAHAHTLRVSYFFSVSHIARLLLTLSDALLSPFAYHHPPGTVERDEVQRNIATDEDAARHLVTPEE